MRSTSRRARSSCDGKTTTLTTGEFSLIKVFVQHPRQPLAREKLMLLARGRDHEVFDRAIDVQVSRLRKLVEPDPANPRYIQTVWGFGYVYVPDDAAPAHADGDAASAGRRLRHAVTLWPRSLFGRLVLLLVVVVALAAVTTHVLFNRDRAALSPGSSAKPRSCSCRRCAPRSKVPRDPSAARRSRGWAANTACASCRRERAAARWRAAPLGPSMRELEQRLRERAGPGDRRARLAAARPALRAT